MSEKINTSKKILSLLLDTFSKKEKERFYRCVINKLYGSFDVYAEKFSMFLADKIEAKGNLIKGRNGNLYIEGNRIIYEIGKVRVLINANENLQSLDPVTLETWILIQVLNLGEGPINVKNIKVSLQSD
ncbi:hypothetical protein SJAV_00930 [Sulfurisphaera javensis]|uniref:Uncharacterized protein n=1 Tax=Sulfurisphaera javensis TaxID=2049879 RepID=A0AAT9GMZ6_9CREN